MELFVDIYIHNLSVSILLMSSWTEKAIKKTLIGNFWYVGEFFGSTFLNEFTDRQSVPKSF
jgi:hypothetical protein